MRTNYINKDTKFVESDLLQHEKISTALTKMIEPESKNFKTVQEYRDLLDIVVKAWNLSIVAPDHLENYPFTSKEAIEIKNMIEHFMNRKKVLFPHDRRVIGAYDASYHGGQVMIMAGAVGDENGPAKF
jgi:hypothetical protein